MRNPESVIEFVNSVSDGVVSHNDKCKVSFDLRNIKTVDNGAIGLLLTLVNALAHRRIRSLGNIPFDESARFIFENSGFLDCVQILQGQKKDKSTDNFIVQSGNNKTNNAIVGKEIKKIVAYLIGEPSAYPPLYSLIGEMISNSIEHANHLQTDKNWLFSIHYDNDKVVLMVTDIGKGILKTLRKKVVQKWKDSVKFKSNVETLYDLFDKKYQSSTFEKNRNKGLPRIK
jgi:K+-sensing histidine kinase KdpD